MNSRKRNILSGGSAFELEEPTLSSCLLLVAGLALIGLALWLIVTQGPISWYLVGSLSLLVMVKSLADLANESAARRPNFLRKITAGSLEDTRKIIRNVGIGSAITLAVQLVLNLHSAEVQANSIGTLEQRVWDAIAALKSLGSLRAVALIIICTLLISALTRSHLPTVLTSKFRKILSTIATFLASVTMFTFVVVDTGQANYQRLSGPIRADIAVKLTETATARKEAAAYRWIAQIVEKKRVEEPEIFVESKRYFSEGEEICDNFQRIYKEKIPHSPLNDADSISEYSDRISLGTMRSAPLTLGRADQMSRKVVGTENITSARPLHSTMKSPSNDLCIKPTFFSALANRIAAFPTDPNATPEPRLGPGDLGDAVKTAPEAVTDDGWIHPPSDKRAGSDTIWLPDFFEDIVHPVPTPEITASEMDLLEEARPTVEVKPARLHVLRSLMLQADKASSDATATRAEMRTLATKSAADLIGESFAIEGVAGSLVDALRDAVLGEIAKRGEAALERWLRQASPGEGVVARASNFMARALFPELPFAQVAVVSAVASRLSAKKVWDASHPDATSAAEVRTVARNAIRAAEVRRPVHPSVVVRPLRPPTKPRLAVRR